jgi:protein phosphatase
MTPIRFDEPTDTAQPAHAWREALSRDLDVDPLDARSTAARVEVAAESVCGRRRYQNTDHYLCIRRGRLQETLTSSLGEGDLPPRFEEYAYAMVVADGLGTRAAGARASRIALSALAHYAIRYGKWQVRASGKDISEIQDQGRFLYRRVNDAILRASRSDVSLANMATSLTAVYIAQDTLFYAHVGHSRAYLFRGGALTQITTDHSVGQPDLEPSEQRFSDYSKPDLSHAVTEAVGGRPGGPQVEIEHFQLWSGDRVLLCTNGLTDVLTNERIADVLALRRRPRDECLHLVALARQADAPDDVTVVIADYRCQSAAPPPAAHGTQPEPLPPLLTHERW